MTSKQAFEAYMRRYHFPSHDWDFYWHVWEEAIRWSSQEAKKP